METTDYLILALLAIVVVVFVVWVIRRNIKDRKELEKDLNRVDPMSEKQGKGRM